jgi:uncharacterized membrane protein
MIEEYLGRLRAELRGTDPAVVQDALYDAEEYLRAAMEERAGEDPQSAFAAAVEEYGSPEEVAAAYREAELTVSRALHPQPAALTGSRSGLARFFGVLMDARAYAALFYLFLAFVTGIVYFTVVVTGVSLSVGLSVLIVGVPIMLLFLGMVRAISLAEGRIVEGLLEERMPRRPRRELREGNLLDRILYWLKDLRTWTTMLYMLLQLALGTIYFSVLTTLLASAAALVAGPVFQIVTGQPIFHSGGDAYLLQPWAAPVVMLAGVLLFVVTLHLAKWVGRGHALYAKAMLVGRFSDE